MADIFISYSKEDRSSALMLSAVLEAKGWSVWWDRSLSAGDEFRDEIMKQLGIARAVIVIWSTNSVKSDWVRSEAGRAHASQKLIPVRLGAVEYDDIPPPFDVLHTEDLASRDLIHGAVLALVAKPPAESQVTKLLRIEMLSSLGIIGAVLTVFTNLDGVIRMAAWARWITTQWANWVAAFWR